MGLREINASRTRQLIVDTAMQLFFERGYESTTMEDIAAQADVGISTVYRYFSTKDHLGTSLLGDPGLMAEELSRRPPDEPAPVALGHALLAFLRASGEEPQRGEAFRRLVSENPRLGVRLLEWLMESQALLADAVASRQGLPAGDLSSRAAAWMAVFVLREVGAADEAGDGRGGAAIAQDIMQRLAGAELRAPSV
jgi:AcrR family transcriptional regulator